MSEGRSDLVLERVVESFFIREKIFEVEKEKNYGQLVLDEQK